MVMTNCCQPKLVGKKVAPEPDAILDAVADAVADIVLDTVLETVSVGVVDSELESEAEPEPEPEPDDVGMAYIAYQIRVDIMVSVEHTSDGLRMPIILTTMRPSGKYPIVKYVSR